MLVEKEKYMPGLVGFPNPAFPEEIILLRQILEQAKLQTKILEDLFLTMDEKKYNRKEAMTDLKKKMAGIVDQTKGTPFEPVFAKMLEEFSK